MRYAWMCRNQGRQLGECDSYAHAPGTGNGAEYDPRPKVLLPQRQQPRMARGIDDWNIFEGR